MPKPCNRPHQNAVVIIMPAPMPMPMPIPDPNATNRGKSKLCRAPSTPQIQNKTPRGCSTYPSVNRQENMLLLLLLPLPLPLLLCRIERSTSEAPHALPLWQYVRINLTRSRVTNGFVTYPFIPQFSAFSRAASVTSAVTARMVGRRSATANSGI
jgi:hypothetical protein